MMEFVQAHASYRFVIRDEEEEKPRILVRFSSEFATVRADRQHWEDLAV